MSQFNERYYVNPPRRWSRQWWHNRGCAPWLTVDALGALIWSMTDRFRDHNYNDPNPYWNWWSAQP